MRLLANGFWKTIDASLLLRRRRDRAKTMWQRDEECDLLPDLLGASGWQGPDETHPPGAGTSCYRIVFKTMRVALQDVELDWPNLRIRFGQGTVNRGGVRTAGAIEGKHDQSLVLPEYGRWEINDGVAAYSPTKRVDPKLEFWEDDTFESFFVECLVDVEPTDSAEIVIAGRRSLASIVSLIELSLGRRLLGSVLTEEAGERFDDGHFNRRVGTRKFRWEASANVGVVTAEYAREWASQVVTPVTEMSERDHYLFSLASNWFQNALNQDVPQVAFIQFWLSIETLAMPDSTHIAPLVTELAALLQLDAASLSEPVGRLNGLRSKLVHGNSYDVSDDSLRTVSTMARALLMARLGVAPGSEAEDLRDYLTGTNRHVDVKDDR